MLHSMVHALSGALVLAVSAQSADPQRPGIIVRIDPVETVTPAPGSPSLDRVTVARDNLQALLNGTRSVNNLTPQELQDVLDFDRMLRGGQIDSRSLEQRCVDQEVQRVGGRPSRLAWRVIELKCRNS